MTTFFIADLHFGDDKLLTTYRRPDGSPLRPFKDVAEMDAEIVKRWNDIVTDDDTVWVLGGLGRKPHFGKVASLNGTKRLIAGNGDNIDFALVGLFSEIRNAKHLPGLMLTYLPVHERQLTDREVNVHGHLRARGLKSAQYVCVSAEQTDYRPISENELRSRIEMKRRHYA
jgi:calcineurin-like phosphoesterase family protein